MTIKNQTKKTTLATHVTEAKSLKDKSIGLLNKSGPTALFFKTRYGIHTIGMKFTIDVIILDKHNRIVKLKTKLKPNNIFFWNPKFDKVIELPADTIKKSKTQIGDIIQIL